MTAWSSGIGLQRYSTLNAISRGRAEVILGRGSSIESFPLFGYDLADYERLFEEKTQLFAELLKGGPVTWQGTTRAPLTAQDVVPHLESGPFPVWVGVGGSPESVIRAARYGFSLMLAIIGGPPARFAPFSQLFQEALQQFGQPERPVGVHAPGHVAETDEQAQHEFWPHWQETVTRIGKQRGFRPPTKESFALDVGPEGALYVGSPETVAQKIVTNLENLGASRFDLKFGMPGLTHQQLMSTVALYGNQVIPRVRELLAAETAATRETVSVGTGRCARRRSFVPAAGLSATSAASPTPTTGAAFSSKPPMPSRPSNRKSSAGSASA
jgi:alkanesulfonate monooxygenase SsuD/methylene tetrahydromethanopterin reductase-like flavin-dependent oxidoreductase (luciferase family)